MKKYYIRFIVLMLIFCTLFSRASFSLFTPHLDYQKLADIRNVVNDGDYRDYDQLMELANDPLLLLLIAVQMQDKSFIE